MMKLLFGMTTALLVTVAGFGAENPLATLQPQHPRLLADKSTWTQLQTRAQTEPQLAAVLSKIQDNAEALLKEKPAYYEKAGKRLLSVSRSARGRLMTLAFAYRLTGNPAFATRAEQEMLAVAAFPDWNPSHFLDTAEMTAALGFGYDWLYDALSPVSREIIRRAIVEKGLSVGIGKDNKGWKQWEHNWNQVCYGGLTVGALSVADEEPEVAGELLRQARQDIGHGLKPYAPDGIYPEGPGYWGYGTSYQVLMIAALESALGTDWNLTQSPGFLASAAVRVMENGPTGLPFNFSDCGTKYGLEPTLFWFARRLNEPELLCFQTEALRATLSKRSVNEMKNQLSALPLVALWWQQPPVGNGGSLPLAWSGRGENPVAIFRSSWTDTNALYLALKGGTAAVNHGHMDAGSFVLDADGVRWAIDLGLQEYETLESKGIALFQRTQESPRWQVFRLNNRAHSTLTIDGQLHRMKGFAPITKFSPGTNGVGLAEVDLSEIFADQATKVTRTFRFDAARRSVVIEDVLSGLKPGADVRWAMVTPAKVRVKGDTATLRQAGRTLQAKLVASEKAEFRVIPADPPRDNFNAANPDARILVANAKAPALGELKFTVILQPGTNAITSLPVLDTH